MSGTTSNVAAMIRPPEVVDPVARLGEVARTGNLLTQNRLLNEQFNSHQAIGQAGVAAIDPATGHFNPDRFRQLMTQNPLSQFMSMEALQQAAGLDLQAEQLKSQQAQLGMLRLNNLRQAIGGLLARQNVTAQDVISEIGRLASLPAEERPFTPTMAAQVLSTMPHDGAGLREFLVSQMARTDAGLAHMQNLLPQGQLINYGGGTMGVTRDPVTGQYSPGGFAQPSTVTPETSNAPVETIGPNGERVLNRNSQVLPLSPGAPPPGMPTLAPPNVGLPAPGGRPPMPGGGAPPPGQSPLGTGRYPTPPAPPPPVTQLSPAQTAALGVTGQSGGQSVARLNASAQQVPQMEALLATADSLIGRAGFEPGPGADWQKWFQSTFNRNVPLLRSMGIQFDPNRIASQEEFNKITAQIAQAQFNALGGTGTDNQLASTSSTSPNEVLSRYGNQGIIAMLRGNNQAIKIQQQEWQRWARRNNAGPERYAEFIADWNNRFDPRVFMVQYLPASTRRLLFESMPREEQERYAQRFREAVQNGWIQRRSPAADAPRSGNLPPERRSGPYEPPQSFGYTGP